MSPMPLEILKEKLAIEQGVQLCLGGMIRQKGASKMTPVFETIAEAYQKVYRPGIRFEDALKQTRMIAWQPVQRH